MILVLVCYNVIGTAVVTALTKIEEFLAPAGADPAKASPGLEKIKLIIAKTVGWAASVGDWFLGNKEH